MLGFSRKADYALVAVAELAQTDARRRSASALAAAIDAPEALLRNILKDLARSGLLLSERGPFGGYVLAREPSRIYVLDIIEAVDGPIRLVRCCGEGETPEQHGCSHSPRCRIQRGMQAMHEGVMGVLRGVSVAELSGQCQTDSTLPDTPLVNLHVEGTCCNHAPAAQIGPRASTTDTKTAERDASAPPAAANTSARMARAEAVDQAVDQAIDQGGS